jgi:hypothetical protein
LNHDHSCDAAWSYLSSDAVRKAWQPNHPLDQVSESTSGYCQARQRLPRVSCNSLCGRCRRKWGTRPCGMGDG